MNYEVLAEYLEYRPNFGDFVWKKRTPGNKSIKVGEVAGYTRPDGYRNIRFNGELYLQHRLVWLAETGAFPEQLVDHIDGNPSNNLYSNLRDVSHARNMQNRTKAARHNQTGLLGVHKQGTRYVARIVRGGVKKHLGSYGTAEEASEEYKKEKAKLEF